MTLPLHPAPSEQAMAWAPKLVKPTTTRIALSTPSSTISAVEPRKSPPRGWLASAAASSSLSPVIGDELLELHELRHVVGRLLDEDDLDLGLLRRVAGAGGVAAAAGVAVGVVSSVMR